MNEFTLPYVVGYELEKAKKLLNTSKCVIIKQTITVFEDKRSERQANRPIVVRQVLKGDKIELTTSLFK